MESFSKDLNKVKYLEKGSIMIYPTETAYAIGCDSANQKAVEQVFKIKKRPKSKSLPLIAGSLAMVERYCVMSEAEKELARKHWPGPLTLILKVKSTLSRGAAGDGASPLALAESVITKDGTAAIRVSANKIARGLSQGLGRPIVSTSANVSGQGECYSIKEVKKQLGGIDGGGGYELLIIDGGQLKKRKPSTIAKIKDGKLRIVRQGEIKIES